MPEATLVISRRLPAPIAEVYRAWTDPELMRHWSCPAEIKVAEVECDADTRDRHEEGWVSCFTNLENFLSA